MSATTQRDSSSGPPQGPQQSQQPPRWSEIEDKILKEAVARYGVNHWEDVARTIWTRKTAEECRARWAELVPVLYEGLVRRESTREQRRTRSVTVSAVASGASMSCQDDMKSQIQEPVPSCLALAPAPAPIAFPAQEQQGAGEKLPPNRADGNATGNTPLAPLSPTVEGSLPLLASESARTRRNTEPAQPFHATPVSRGRGGGEREWLAPHPLMRGRQRNTPTSSRDSSTLGKKG
ncbi:uncharacterized protein F4812DRAFT_211061 [Daldinia caldariorum]|uniref:uncharacterized protein n=1 Tax=Daldinia caldariorum TaxID=326644 RepID=UPI0020082D91|nr:uncharacterized protein F4812DRAFT_211061 [Daldinia caldariorum]KAI1464413.1 hypothetical protein F4812DRAFT_211061 [Daldinia caldariorum]